MGRDGEGVRWGGWGGEGKGGRGEEGEGEKGRGSHLPNVRDALTPPITAS